MADGRWTRTAAVGCAVWLLSACAAWGQMIAERIAPDVVRFYASSAARTAAEPSVAMEGSWPSLGSLPAGWPVLPVFTTVSGNVRVTVPVPAGSHVYGTGLVAGPLERTGRFTTLYNDDSYAWGDGDQQLYQSHPWVLVVRPNGTSFGVLFDSTWRSTIDLTNPAGQGIRFEQTSTAGFPAVVIIERNNPSAVVMALSDLTGRPFMPPLWSLGYQQSRYSYTPASRAIEVAQGFRDRRMPGEVMWFDIDYMNGFRIFTFNPSTFPNPAATNATLDTLGFQGVWMINPGVKFENGYSIYESGRAGDHFVKQSNQTSDFVGDVWPGASVWPDFTRAATRQWWAALYPPYLALGVDGVWNDMNEPAVFNSGSGWTMPNGNWHRADAALGGAGTHLQFHNIYGMQMVRASREGFLLARPEQRPFVLSRANYLGGQRYAATWSGDNVANWYHLDVSISNVLNLGLSGQPNSGPDIGGFVGDGDATLFTRWMGVGAMLPFARGHTSVGTRDKEPWSYGAGSEGTIRLALQRRYQLLPHMYTLLHEAHTTGLPVVRPLFFAEPGNGALRTRDDEFLLGSGLVVACATSQGATPQRPPMTGILRRFGLPVSNLPGAGDDANVADLPHLFLRGGAIVPVGPVRQFSREGPLDALTLLVALDESGFATGTLYEDAGDGWGYQSGDFRRTTYTAYQDGGVVRVVVSAVEGSRPAISRPVTVRLLTGDLQERRGFGRDGEEIVISLADPVIPSSPADARHIDGRRLTEAFGPGDLIAVQDTAAGSQNNSNELNQLWMRAEAGGVRIGLSGNLATDGSALALFLDTQPGGQNVVNTNSLSPPPAGLQALTNTRLETGFEADRLMFVNAFGGAVYADWIELSAGGAHSKRYIGQQAVASGFGLLSGGLNQAGIQVALDNSNTAGVGAGSVGDRASATTGFEIFIPDAALGTGHGACREVRVFAALVAPDGSFRAQTLPGLAGGAGPGVAPNFATIGGSQTATGSAFAASDLDGDGVIGLEDVYRAFGTGGTGPCVERAIRQGEAAGMGVRR
jgi:alpha-glucosidase